MSLTLPRDIEAEKAVLACIMLEPQCLDDVATILTATDFFDLRHRAVWSAFEYLRATDTAIDMVTVNGILESRAEGPTEKVPADYLIEICESLPTAAYVESYAKVVRQRSALRRVMQLGLELAREAATVPADADEFLADAERKMLDATTVASAESFVRAPDLVDETLEEIAAVVEADGGMLGAPTGFPDLDHLLWGLQPTDLLIIAGRPSMGKTAFALNLSVNVAKAGRGVAIFSLEMSNTQLMQRIVCAEARVDYTEVRAGANLDQHLPRLVLAADTVSQLPLAVDYSASLTLADIRARARKAAREPGFNLGLVVVDYLQLMRDDAGQDGNREQQVAGFSRGLKQLARELQVPVIALSQLNRALEARIDKRPVMSDLRESGAIEQDADVIMFLYRPVVYDKIADPGEAEVIVAKQRKGPIGTVPLRYSREHVRFESVEIGSMFGNELG